MPPSHSAHTAMRTRPRDRSGDGGLGNGSVRDFIRGSTPGHSVSSRAAHCLSGVLGSAGKGPSMLSRPVAGGGRAGDYGSRPAPHGVAILSCAVLATALLLTGCIGSNRAFRGVQSWNTRATDSKWGNEVIHAVFWILPVYPLCLAGDILI